MEVQSKKQTRAEAEDLLKKFLASGGKIKTTETIKEDRKRDFFKSVKRKRRG